MRGQAKNKSIERETDLYRAYDADGALLYVGISFSSMTRAEQHRKAGKWFHLLASFRVEKFKTRDEALDAERTAIITEHPKFNVMHNKPKPQKQKRRRSGPLSTDVVINRRTIDCTLFTPEEQKRLLAAANRRA